MSPAEKRHFKLYNQIYKGSKKDFIKLFDFLNDLQEFDSGRIDKFIEKQKIPQKYICISYLLDKVTASISSVDKGPLYTDAEAIITAHLDKFHVYYKMELLVLAYKELEKAEKIATKYEMHTKLIDVYNKQTWLLQSNQFVFDDGNSFVEIYQKIEAAVEQLRLFSEVHQLAVRILEQPEEDAYKRAISDLATFTEDHENNIGPNGKTIIYMAWFFHYFNNLAFENAAVVAQKVVRLYGENVYLIELNVRIYIVQWNNILVAHIRAKNIKLADKLYKEFEEIPQKYKKLFDKQYNAHQALAIHRFTCHRIELMLIFAKKNYDGVKVLEEEIAESQTEFPNYLSVAELTRTFFLRFAYALILVKEYENGEHWLGKLLEASSLSKNGLLYEEAEILQLIIYYECQGEVLMESRIRSLDRKWKNEPPKSSYTSFMFKLLKALRLKKNQKNIPKLLTRAYEDAVQIEDKTYHLLSFSHWIEHRNLSF